MVCNSEIMDMLLISREGISLKLDAIALLTCIAMKYPEDYKCNQSIYVKLFVQQVAIRAADYLIT